jgi:hypothetical protein
MSFPLKNLVGNHKSARPIVYKGVRYPSRRALAAALGISVVTLRKRLRERTQLESPTKVPLELLSEQSKEPELTIRKHRGVVYKGVAYDTIYDCAAEFDLTPFVVRYRLKHGIPLEVPLGFRKVTVIDGKEWYSQKEIAEACGVSKNTIWRRLKEGKDIRPDLCGHRGKACEYQGKRYPSIAALARELGIYPSDARLLVENDGRWL